MGGSDRDPALPHLVVPPRVFPCHRHRDPRGRLAGRLRWRRLERWGRPLAVLLGREPSLPQLWKALFFAPLLNLCRLPADSDWAWKRFKANPPRGGGAPLEDHKSRPQKGGGARGAPREKVFRPPGEGARRRPARPRGGSISWGVKPA